MFILTKILDLVQIEPQDFKKGDFQCIEDNINAKYANKVIQNIGLCICLYDLLKASDGLIGNGTGLVNVNIECRLIVFRPFKHEVMCGRISSSTEQGMRIRTHFFDEIFVPATMLPDGAYFDRNEQCFKWRTDDEQELYYDNQDHVRFRVEEEHWHDQTPIGPRAKEDEVKRSPYTITATMEDAGLGPCLWWDGDEEEEEMED